jgi:hypothetical protein
MLRVCLHLNRPLAEWQPAKHSKKCLGRPPFGMRLPSVISGGIELYHPVSNNSGCARRAESLSPRGRLSFISLKKYKF